MSETERGSPPESFVLATQAQVEESARHLPWVTPDRPGTLDITATDDCPLACTFCFNRANRGGRWDGHRCWTAVRWLLDQQPKTEEAEKIRADTGKPPRANLIWLGGEPALHLSEILDMVELARAEYPHLHVGSSFTTNLVPLNRRLLERAKSLTVPPHCSIDGTPESHDCDRRFADGRPSSPVVFRHARWVLEAFPGASMRLTVVPANVEHLAQSCAYLARMGFRDIAVSLATGPRWDAAALRQLRAAAMETARWWVATLTGAGLNIKISFIDQCLRAIWRPQQNWHLCHAGVTRAAADSDGRLWPCDYWIACPEPERWSVGRIDRPGYADDALPLRRLVWYACNRLAATHGRAAEACGQCRARAACSFHCLYASWAEAGDVVGAEPHWYCAMVRAWWDAAWWAHNELIARGFQWYLALYAPADLKPPPPPKNAKRPPRGRPASRIEMLARIPAPPGTPPVLHGAPVPAEAIAKGGDADDGRTGNHTVEKPGGAHPAENTRRRARVILWGKKGGPKALADGLEAAGWSVDYDDRASGGWQRRAIDAIRSADAPRALAVWQRLYDPHDRNLRLALEQNPATRLMVMDFGAGFWGGEAAHYNSVLIDGRGEGAESELAGGGMDRLLDGSPTARAGMEASRLAADTWRKQWRSWADGDEGRDERLEGKDFALFLAQDSRPDAHLIYDAGREDQRPQSTAVEFVRQCQRAGLVPVIKPHPLDDFARRWSPTARVFPDVVWSGPERPNDIRLAWLMRRARLVVLVNSTLVWPAIALRAPVVQLGRGATSGNGVVYEGRLGESMNKLISRANPANADDERLDRFLALLASREWRCGTTNDAAGQSRNLRDPQVAAGAVEYFETVAREMSDGAMKAVAKPAETAKPQPVPTAKRATGRMRIAVLIRSLAWPSGCARRHLAIADWLDRAGHDVAVYAIHPGHPRNLVRSVKEIRPGERFDLVITGWPPQIFQRARMARLGPSRDLFLLVTHDCVAQAAHMSRTNPAETLIAPISEHLGAAYLATGGRPDRMRVVANGVDARGQFIAGEWGNGSGRAGLLWRDRLHRDADSAARPPETYPLGEALGRKFSPEDMRMLLWEAGGPGRIDPNRMGDAYRAVRLVVLAETRRAGGCNTILEAAACATPVVALDVPATREMIVPGKTGWLVRDVGEAARLAAELIGETETLAAVGGEARRWAERWDWSRYCAELAEFAGIPDLRGGAAAQTGRDDEMAIREAVSATEASDTIREGENSRDGRENALGGETDERSEAWT